MTSSSFSCSAASPLPVPVPSEPPALPCPDAAESGVALAPPGYPRVGDQILAYPAERRKALPPSTCAIVALASLKALGVGALPEERPATRRAHVVSPRLLERRGLVSAVPSTERAPAPAKRLTEAEAALEALFESRLGWTEQTFAGKRRVWSKEGVAYRVEFTGHRPKGWDSRNPPFVILDPDFVSMGGAGALSFAQRTAEILGTPLPRKRLPSGELEPLIPPPMKKGGSRKDRGHWLPVVWLFPCTEREKRDPPMNSLTPSDLSPIHPKASLPEWLRAVERRLSPGTPESDYPSFERGDTTEVARRLYELLAAENVLYDEGEIYRYDSKGTWEVVPYTFLQAIVAGLAGANVSTPHGNKGLGMSWGFANSTVLLVERLIQASPRNRTFANAAPGLVFSNGFLMLIDGIPALVPNGPENMARFSYDVPFVLDAPTPLFDAFLAQTALSALDVALLQEFVGACLFGQAPKLKKSLLLVGPGGYGKSQFLTIARSLFPSGSTCWVPPCRWSSSFEIAELSQQLGNFVDELPSLQTMKSRIFQAVLEGRFMVAERRCRGSADFRPVAGHFFCPSWVEDRACDAIAARMIVVSFSEPPSGGRAPTEAASAIVRDERAAVVSWAVRGYQRLVANTMRTSLDLLT